MRVAFLAAWATALAGESYAQQGARYERWDGASIASPQALADNPNALGNPSVSQTLVNFEAPVNVAGQFVARITASFTAPETGMYVFWIASNGQSMAWVAPSQNFAGMVPMARMTRSTIPTRNQWTRNCEQKSGVVPAVTCPDGIVNPVINLTAGQTYHLLMVYMDTAVESGTNVNHASMKWMLPSGVQEGPIPGARIRVPTQQSGTGSVGLAWDAETASGYTVGYRVLYGTVAGAWDQSRDVGNATTASLSGLAAGTRLYFVVVAVNSAGQAGPPSNQVSCIPSSSGPCGSVQSVALTDAALAAFAAGNGRGEGAAPDQPPAPNALKVDDSVHPKDTWMLDTAGWSRAFTLAWTVDPKQPDKLVSREWVFHPSANVELPGPMASGADIPFSPPGMRYVAKSLYVPAEGQPRTVIRGADWSTHNATMLVTFEVLSASDTEIRVARTGLLARLEGDKGLAVYLKGPDGGWATAYLPPTEDFDILVPGDQPWLAVQPPSRK